MRGRKKWNKDHQSNSRFIGKSSQNRVTGVLVFSSFKEPRAVCDKHREMLLRRVSRRVDGYSTRCYYSYQGCRPSGALPGSPGSCPTWRLFFCAAKDKQVPRRPYDPFAAPTIRHHRYRQLGTTAIQTPTIAVLRVAPRRDTGYDRAPTRPARTARKVRSRIAAARALALGILLAAGDKRFA